MTNARALRDLGPDPVWVRFRGVSKAFGAAAVLRDVDVCFRPGRITALVGPNGAGKTTLLKMLLGLVRPDEGVVSVGEVPVADDPEVRRAIGYMPQLPRFPDNLNGAEILAMLDDVRGVGEPPDESLIETFGLAPELAKPVRTLSGGNRQKLNAAQALRYRSPVLVLDEPTAGLDPLAARLLKERVLAERDRGRTVLLTSHDLGQLAALADDVVFLLEGTVHFEGETDELLASTGAADLEGALATLISRGSTPGDGPVSAGTDEEVA